MYFIREAAVVERKLRLSSIMMNMSHPGHSLNSILSREGQRVGDNPK